MMVALRPHVLMPFEFATLLGCWADPPSLHVVVVTTLDWHESAR